jgi:hypothetical protein
MLISTMFASLVLGLKSRRSAKALRLSVEESFEGSPHIRYGSRAAWLAAVADLPPYHPE